MIKKTILAALTFMAGAAALHAQSSAYAPDLKSFTKVWSSDQGDGTYKNPVVNADFPDIDLLRVGDTYYMMTTTMYHFPGATILKSKDLVNWEFCANPLQKIDDNDAYNLLNGKHHYSQGQWATSLSYHDGLYYLYFICYGRSGVDNTQQILLTTDDPEGSWKMAKMADHYYDSGWLFDDGENGDGNLYVACGIGDIWVNKLDASTLVKKDSKRVLSLGNGLEGCRMYHIGDYYYIYATYGGTEGSQTIFRSKNPMGPYEEHEGRIFANQHIHQGALVETQTGEWWTIIFKDAGAIGRIPYLEPVKWENGWPILGNNGIDVTKGGKAYPKPNVGAEHPKSHIDSNDPFVSPVLGKQWQWNHNWVEDAWSLTERPGYLRLYTASVTDDLNSARNSLTQRIQGYNANDVTSSVNANSFGLVKMDISGMQDGDVAGLSVFQNPYSFIGVKMENGKKVLYSERCTFNNQTLNKEEAKTGKELTSDVVYFKAIVNFSNNSCRYLYSVDNKNWTSWGCTMQMRYTLDYFVGQRFYLFNYATKSLGGHVDIDWFSTESTFTEEAFYSPERLVEMAQMPASPKADPSQLFPLTVEGFQPDIYGRGSVKVIQAGGKGVVSFIPEQNGFGGWKYKGGVDISDYKYIVVKFLRKPTSSTQVRVYGKDNYWAAPYEYNVTGKECVIDIQNMKTSLGEPLDPASIYMIGFQSTGASQMYISEMFLSNDGVTDVATGIGSPSAAPISSSAMYTTSGIAVDRPAKGVTIMRSAEETRKVVVGE